MQDLPVEVWLCVTENLGDGELQALIGVNGFFFNLGMGTRYGELLLDTSEQGMGHYLDHLMETQVATRVKKLAVHLRSAPPAAHRSPSPGFGKRFVTRIRSAVRKIIPDRGVALADTTLPQVQSDLPPYDLAVVQKLGKVLSRMVNVTDFRIVTWAMPLSKHLDTLYASAWDTFGDNLLRVSLCAHLEGHQALIDSNPRLAKVEALELEFSDNVATLPTNSEEGTEALVGTVVPFVNKLSPQVKTLKIRSWGKIDLSLFFLHINSFPNLEATLIRIPFNYSLRADPSGLARLLRESPALTNVALRLTPIGLALDPNREEPLCEWLQDLLSEPLCFARAKEIDICPTHLPGGRDILRICIEHSSEHLRTFKLRDRYLQPEDVASLIPELQLATSLTRLRLNVIKLSAPMFDAFARSLLGLESLWLSVGDADSASSNALTTFRNEMISRKYNDWKLWDLSIWQGGMELDGETMLAISQSIPSLRSFWETGHKRLPHEGRVES